MWLGTALASEGDPPSWHGWKEEGTGIIERPVRDALATPGTLPAPTSPCRPKLAATESEMCKCFCVGWGFPARPGTTARPACARTKRQYRSRRRRKAPRANHLPWKRGRSQIKREDSRAGCPDQLSLPRRLSMGGRIHVARIALTERRAEVRQQSRGPWAAPGPVCKAGALPLRAHWEPGLLTRVGRAVASPFPAVFGAVPGFSNLDVADI